MGGLFVIALSNEVISGWLFMDVLSINPQAGKQSYRFEQFSKRECKTFIATKSDSDRRVTVRGKDTAVVQIDFWPSPPSLPSLHHHQGFLSPNLCSWGLMVGPVIE